MQTQSHYFQAHEQEIEYFIFFMFLHDAEKAVQPIKSLPALRLH